MRLKTLLLFIVLIVLGTVSLAEVNADYDSDEMNNRYHSNEDNETESIKYQCEGFGSPEEAVIAYVDAWSKSDLPRMLSTFAIESYVDNVDQIAAASRQTVFGLNSMFGLPIVDEYTRAVAIAKRHSLLESGLCLQFAEWIWPEEYGDISKYVSFNSENEVSRKMDAFRRNEIEAQFQNVSLCGFLDPFKFNKENYESFVNEEVEELVSIYGCDEIIDMPIWVSINGIDYMMSPYIVCYDGKWFLLDRSGAIGRILGYNPYTCLGKIENPNDYLRDVDLNNAYHIPDHAVQISDHGIEKCIRDIYGISWDQDITKEMCDHVKELHIEVENAYGYSDDVVKSLSDLSKFPSLEKLYIDNKGVADIDLHGLEKATTLIELSLIDCRIKEIYQFESLVNLEYLFLAGGKITDLMPIAELKQLRSLHLFIDVEQGGMAINQLSKLEELELGTCVRGYGLDWRIDGYPIYDYLSLSNLTELKRLSISYQHADPEWIFLCLQDSGSIEKLEYLDLGYTDISSMMIREFFPMMSNLRYLHLNVGSEKYITGIGELKNLQALDLSGHRQEMGFIDLSNLSRLRSLKLDYLLIDDLKTLNLLSRLEFLSVDPHDDFSFQALTNMKALKCILFTTQMETFPIPHIDLSGIEEMKSIEEIIYCENSGVKFVSQRPLDNRPDIKVRTYYWNHGDLPDIKAYCSLTPIGGVQNFL